MASNDVPRAGELRPDARVGRWAIEGSPRHGASGAVFAARDAGGGSERVAIKVLLRALADDPVSVRRFERECEALRAIDHPSVLPVIDHGRLEDGRPWLATPWIDGANLREALAARGRPYSPAEAWALLRTVGAGLAAAHARGVIHRDVKPDNIVVPANGGGPVLVDFGLARPPRGRDPRRSLTGEGVPVGTPAYMPPEQWWNQRVTHAADQYSLAVTFLELVTGSSPFESPTFAETMRKHLDAPAPTLEALGVAGTPALEEWLARSLSREPDARFASMDELVREGDRRFPDLVATTTEHESTRARIVPFAASVLTMAAACALGYAGSHDPREWIRLAGGAGYMIAAFGGIGLLLMLRREGATVPLLLPACVGVISTWQNHLAVQHHLARYPEGRRFEIVMVGLAEANAASFLGYACTLALVVGGLARKDRVTDDEGGATSWSAVALLVLLAAAGAVFGALGAVVVPLVAAGALASSKVTVGTSRALRAALVVALTAGMAWARVASLAGTLWSDAPHRAARALGLTRLAQERSLTVAAAAVSLLVLAVVLRESLAPAFAPGFWRPRHRRWVGLTMIAWAVGEVAVGAVLDRARTTARNSMASRFALLASLDPPEGRGARRAHLAPSLQLTRTAVVVDGRRVGLVAGLASEAGTTALATDLAHALARPENLDEGVQLSITVDASVRWLLVRRALGVARGLGVRRCEVLLRRGPTLVLPPSAPPEAAWVDPRDFVAVPVELVDEPPGFARDGDSFLDIAPRVRAPSGEPLRVSIAPLP